MSTNQKNHLWPVPINASAGKHAPGAKGGETSNLLAKSAGKHSTTAKRGKIRVKVLIVFPIGAKTVLSPICQVAA